MRRILLVTFLATNILFQHAASAVAEEQLPFDVPKNPRALPETALIETEKGSFEIEFYRDVAPVTVASFAHLIEKNFYNGTKFHRYVPNFVLQGGDPQGTGQGGPGYTLPPEHSSVEHERGTIGMARLPGEKNPERRSNGSQFYICLTKSPHLDGLYTVFARVVHGMDVVEKLRIGDKIIRMRLPKQRDER